MAVEISIIIPFYNMEDSLHHTMDALLHQSLPMDEYEVIAVDDHSTDGTYFALRDYEERYPGRVRVLRTDKNLRQGGARNLGMREAKGEWIGFMDGDDYPAPDMYERMLKRVKETGADVCGCDYTKVFDYEGKPGEVTQGNSEDQAGVLSDEQKKSLILNPSSMVTKIYKASVIREKKLTFPEGIFYEDNAAAPIWMLSFEHFEVIKSPLYFYYQNPGSTTHTITRQRCYDRMRAGELLVELAGKRGYLERFPEEFEAAFTKLYYVNTLFSYLIGSGENSADFLDELKAGMLKSFPRFRENRYYELFFDREQRKLIDMHMKSSSKLLLYYRALSFYRKLRS